MRAHKDGACLVFPGDWRWDRLARFLGELHEKAKREAKLEADGKAVQRVADLQQLM